MGFFDKYFVKTEEMAVDPVCSMRIIREGKLNSKFAGKDFYFCSENCLKEFLKDPTAYFKG